MPAININAWREIIARIFEGFKETPNIVPDWLVNPATNRKLKLDLLYPEIGLAVRFEGLKVKGQSSRLTLDEEIQEREREEARLEVCREHGITLATLQLSTAEISEIFQTLETAMSRASRLLAQNQQLAPASKSALVEKLSRARGKAAQLKREITTEQALSTYSALWYDRQFKLEQEIPAHQPAKPALKLAKGMEVEHSHFGAGVVVAVTPGENDTLITIDFFQAGQRTFMAGLLGDKITIQ